jgi:hypothetical protein
LPCSGCASATLNAKTGSNSIHTGNNVSCVGQSKPWNWAAQMTDPKQILRAYSLRFQLFGVETFLSVKVMAAIFRASVLAQQFAPLRSNGGGLMPFWSGEIYQQQRFRVGN